MHNELPLRSRMAAGSLLLAPIGLGVAGALRPEAGDDGASLLATVAADPGRWSLTMSIALLSSGLLVVGLAHLASRLPQRARLAAGGLFLWGAGALGQAALAATELVLVPISRSNQAAVVQAVDRISASSELGVIFLLYLPGTLFGGLLLFAGLWRSGVLPRWAGLVGLASVVFGFAFEDAVPVGDLLTAALTVVALLPAVIDTPSAESITHRPRTAAGAA